jgi:pantoate kinase
LTKFASAFAPAAISSFFEICDYDSKGKAITDLRKVGARGGGFGLRKGLLTHVTVSALGSKTDSTVNVYINGQLSPQAKTTKTVIQKLLCKNDLTYNVEVWHSIDVPIGSGFGTSAGGGLTAGLAFKEALGLPMTLNEIGSVAHIAEIECQTGLGTVSSLTECGGCILVVEPGAPGECIIDHIPLTPDYVVIAGVFQGGVSKVSVLSSAERKRSISHFGRRTLNSILADPSLDNFLACCWEFAQDAGFATDRVRKLVELSESSGAIGAAQNMVGEAVHAVTLEKNVSKVVEAFKQVLPQESIIVSKLDFQGVRLVSEK